MSENDDFIDELNWYSEDFEPSKPISNVKKERAPPKPRRIKASEKEKRTKEVKISAVPSKSSLLINVLEHQSQRKSVVQSKKQGRQIIRSWDSKDAPVKKAAKIEKPDIVLYKPSKSISKVRDSHQPNVNPFVKPLSKSTEVVMKSEVVKTVESFSNFHKTPQNSKAMQILTGKLALLEERDKLIRISLDKPSNLKQAQTIKGTCPDMCPEKERIMRSLKKMVSVFECLPNSSEMDHNLAVKEYARSSADQEEPLPHELRPEPVLSMSMSYLISKVISKFEECDDISAWYDFCWNRLRAIRKDIVQQQLCNLETVTIVEQCARFHIVCFDRFWGMDSSVFDEKINTENLMNCLKILLNLYGDLRKQGIKCPNEPEFNAYMILIKMNSGDLLWEFLNFPFSLQQTVEVIEAVKIHMYYNSNMYSQFFNSLIKTSYLNACLMQRCFSPLRVKALETIVKAYCPPSKEGKVSLQHIMKSLKFDSKEDALAFCRSCNIWYVDKMGFKISHTKFIRPETLLKVKTPSSLVCNKRIDLAQAVVGLHDQMPTYFERKVHNSFLNDKTLHPDSLDASDQEERMLRDNVERKLLMKTVKSSPTKESRIVSSVPPSTPILQRSVSSLSDRRKSQESNTSSQAAKSPDKTPFEFSFSVEPEDVEMEEDLSESEDYDMPDSILQVDGKKEKAVEEKVDNVFVDVQDENTAESERETELGIYLDSHRVSPLSSISDEPVIPIQLSDHEEDVHEDEDVDLIEVPDEIAEEITSPIRVSPPVVSVPSSLVSQNTFTVTVVNSIDVQPCISTPTEGRSSFTSQRDNRSISVVTKLKNKLRLNLQRVSAKKYGRIWREKVRNIKKSYGFVPLISHMNMKEYLNVWGRSVSKPGSILNQLKNTKKLCSSVDSLLLFNLFDSSSKKLSYPICETLVNQKLKTTTPFGGFRQNCPIYWKLVFSLPSPKVSGYNLSDQIVTWIDEVFFSSEVARNTKIETMIFKGVKVHFKITVLEGFEKLENGRNLSSLIMLNVPGWESTSESQNRLNRLISFSNHPIPIYVINLAPSQTSLTVPSVRSVPFFKEVVATPGTNIGSFLKELAFNSYQMSVTSLHICDLMNEMLDKFVDSLQDDCFNSTGFFKTISNPANIIYIYNLLIDKLKKEILDIYKSNIFGTADEIISTITPNSKYINVSLTNVLGNYFDSLNIGGFQWSPNSSKDLLYYLKNFCEKAGIPQVLSQVIRMINPPDEDSNSDKSFLEFLDNLDWLRIMEVIIKAHFRTKFCDVIVTYSDKSVNDLIDSHWWMECDMVLKHCKK